MSRSDRLYSACADLFHQLQGRHHGGKPPATGRSDDGWVLAGLNVPPTELRDVICWLWLSPNADYWRQRISTIGAFVNAFDELDVQCFRTVPAWWRPGTGLAVPAAATMPPVGAVTKDETQIDRAHRAALEVADIIDGDPEPITVAEARARAREALRLPQRKDLE